MPQQSSSPCPGGAELKGTSARYETYALVPRITGPRQSPVWSPDVVSQWFEFEPCDVSGPLFAIPSLRWNSHPPNVCWLVSKHQRSPIFFCCARHAAACFKPLVGLDLAFSLTGEDCVLDNVSGNWCWGTLTIIVGGCCGCFDVQAQAVIQLCGHMPRVGGQKNRLVGSYFYPKK